MTKIKLKVAIISDAAQFLKQSVNLVIPSTLGLMLLLYLAKLKKIFEFFNSKISIFSNFTMPDSYLNL